MWQPQSCAGSPEEESQSGGSYNARINLQKFNVNATRRCCWPLLLMLLQPQIELSFFWPFFLALFIFDCLYSIFGFEAARCCPLLPALAAGNRRTFKRVIWSAIAKRCMVQAEGAAAQKRKTERGRNRERAGETLKTPHMKRQQLPGPGRAEHQIGSTLAALWQMATIKKPFAAFSCATLQRNQEKDGVREGGGRQWQRKKKNNCSRSCGIYLQKSLRYPRNATARHKAEPSHATHWSRTGLVLPRPGLACSSPAVKLPNAWKQTSIEIEFNSKQF